MHLHTKKGALETSVALNVCVGVGVCMYILAMWPLGPFL